MPAVRALKTRAPTDASAAGYRHHPRLCTTAQPREIASARLQSHRF